MQSEGEPQMSPIQQSNARLDAKGSGRYQALLDAESTGVYTCDAAGVITFYNSQAAELWGRTPALGDTDEKFCGSRMLFRTDGKFMPHYQRPMADVLAGKVASVHDAEVYVQRPDGTRIVVIVNIAPLIDDNGEIVGAVNTFCASPLRKNGNGQHHR
jgi:PAS domain S-box-containing protein